MTEQMTFDLPARPALGRDEFFVSPANAVAVATMDDWVNWPAGKLVLQGPQGAGKTHLAHVWAATASAAVVFATELGAADIGATVRANKHIAVEDIDKAIGTPELETALFHLHNLVLAEGGRLLMTRAPGTGQFGLPDLQSRISASGLARLDPPDDALLSAVLVKLFADRQLSVSSALIAYLVTRMERSFDRAGQLVAALDSLSLARKRPITRALASEVLDNFVTGRA